MIDELLQLSRAGERTTAGERLALPELAGRAAQRWSATAAGRDQRLSVSTDGAGAAWISAEDADRILDALVENALNYSPGGTEVEIAVVGSGIAVRDRGPGLTAGEEEQVFERFHRGGAGRRGPAGTGLGLPIARALARQWGGEVTLRAREGGGTVAEVRLPPA